MCEEEGPCGLIGRKWWGAVYERGLTCREERVACEGIDTE